MKRRYLPTLSVAFALAAVIAPGVRGGGGTQPTPNAATATTQTVHPGDRCLGFRWC